MTERRSEKRKSRNKKINIIILLMVLTILLYIIQTKTSLSKYVYNAVHNYYLQSKGFYFNSDKLSIYNTEFEIENNWSGAETYTITVNLNSKKNDLVFAEADIDYTIQYTTSDNIEGSISKNEGRIIGSQNGGINEDYFVVTINPATGKSLVSGEVAWIDIVATATKPYTATISGRLIIQAGAEDITYEIIDSVNKPYIEVNITNSLNQQKDVTLQFDPNILLLDMTSRFSMEATNVVTSNIGEFQYVNELTSKVNALETTTIKFYKIDPSQNYEYQYGDENTPVVQLTY